MFFSFETFFSSLIKMTIIITYCANVEHFVHLGTRRRGSWSSEERRDSSRQSGPRWRPINQQNGGNEEVDEESPFSAEEREARAEVISFRRRPEVDIARDRRGAASTSTPPWKSGDLCSLLEHISLSPNEFQIS